MSNPYLKRQQKRRASKPLTSNEVGLRYGFRSGLEERIASELQTESVEFEFEETKLEYTKPQKVHTYTPDFYLPKQQIFIETKGLFTSADRQKMRLVKEQHPDLDIRFILIIQSHVSVRSQKLLTVCGVINTDFLMLTNTCHRSGYE